MSRESRAARPVPSTIVCARATEGSITLCPKFQLVRTNS
jgi:hypothetical protein